MACFSCYNEYFNNFEKAKHIEQTMTKTNRAFRDFADHVKHSSSNLGNVSIRELIMEPVQRIPRYKMFLDGLIKALPPQYQAQRARLESAVVVCSHIANCEIDEKTQRAAVLWSFGRNVQGFPVRASALEPAFPRMTVVPRLTTSSFLRRLACSPFIDASSMQSTSTIFR